MPNLDSKIQSFNPEIYRKLNEGVAPTNTSSINTGSLVVGYALQGDAVKATTVNDGPIGSDGICYNLNQQHPTQFSNGLNFTANTALANATNDRDYYQGMWLKFVTVPNGASAVRLMCSNASTVGSFQGFSIPIQSRTGGGYKAVLQLSNGTSFFSTSSATPINITDGNWHYLAVRRYGNTFDMYVDGVLEATGTSSVTSTTYTYAFGNGSGYNQSAYVMRMGHLHFGTTANFPATAPMDIWLAGNNPPSKVVKYFDGTNWQTSSAQKVWNGTAWIDWTAKKYDGSQWITI